MKVDKTHLLVTSSFINFCKSTNFLKFNITKLVVISLIMKYKPLVEFFNFFIMKQGLSQKKATELLKKFGYNELPQAKPKNVWQIAKEVIQEPMFILLMFCGLVYVLLGDYTEGMILLCWVFVIIFITFLSASAVVNGDITLGMMLSIQYIVGQLNLPLSNFIGFIQLWQDAKISLERLWQVHSKDDEDAAELNKAKELPENKSIIIKNLSFQYGSKSSQMVLKNLSFEITQGKTTAIVGASALVWKNQQNNH